MREIGASADVEELIERASHGPLAATDELIAVLEAALDREDVNGWDRGRLLLGSVLINQGRLPMKALTARSDEALDLLSRFEPEPGREEVEAALAISAGFNSEIGNLGVALELCLRLADRDDLTPRVKHNFGVTLNRLGAFRASGQLFSEVLSSVDAVEQRFFAVTACMNQLTALSRQRLVSPHDLDVDRHMRGLELVASVAEAVRGADLDDDASRLAQLVCAIVAQMEGDGVAADELWGDTDAFEAHPEESFTALLALSETRLALARNDLERAEEILARCPASSDQVRSLPLGGVEVALLTADLHFARGDHWLAAEALRDATSLALADRRELPDVLMDQVDRRVELERTQAALIEETSALARQSLIDGLSGMANRRSLDRHLSKVRAEGERPVAVIIGDIDRFKEINDKYGHVAGDRVIEAVGRLFARTCRATDFVARFGGEEFVVIPAAAARSVVASLAERVRRAFLEFDWSEVGVDEGVTCSVGYAIGPSETIDDVLIEADAAMYRAKRSGRNAVEAGRTSF